MKPRMRFCFLTKCKKGRDLRIYASTNDLKKPFYPNMGPNDRQIELKASIMTVIMMNKIDTR